MKGFVIFITESRAFQSARNLFIFIAAMGIVCAPETHWLIGSLFILLPYSFVSSFNIVFALFETVRHLPLQSADIIDVEENGIELNEQQIDLGGVEEENV
jgi:hypothetical protein